MKSFRILVLFISYMLSNLLFEESILALEKETHYFLNEKIVAVTNLDNYLKTNLGLVNGIKEELNGKQVLECVKEGGKYEDEPMYTRSFNHFHNPLKTWDTAGFKGTFQSSVIWAQDQGFFGSLWGGNFSWKKVREYFYIALTGRDFNGTLMAYTQSEKEKYFGKTFQGIGQIMHLVQDMSVPSHTRNDAHVVGYHYELAVENNIRNSKDPNIRKIFEDAVANPITFDPYMLAFASNPLAPIPIAKIFDTDKYRPESPDPAVTVGSAIGLSEYSNANFVSEGLISANFQDFPYPRISDMQVVEKQYTGSSGTYTRQYYLKNCCGETNSGKGYLLATVDYLDYWRQKHPVLSSGLPKLPGMDDNVYKDYTSLLIPRAVGYSAGLLDYFFRGNIEIILPASGVYAQTDNLATGFSQIILLAKNITPNNEQMNDGTIELVVGYRRAIDDPFLNYPEDYPFRAENEMTYIIVPEANGISSIPNNGSVELTFDLSQKPIPLWAINVFIRLIYHGRLGNEEGAVVVGFKDISEPTSFDLFSDMDKICLNGSLYVAGSPEAIDQVDTNNNGIPTWDIYPHDLSDIYFRTSPKDNPQYASDTNYNIAVPYLNAGYYIRASYILTDYTFSYNSYQKLIKKDTDDTWGHTAWTSGINPGIAIKNQVEYEEDPAVCAPMSAPCNIWWYPTFLTYRGVNIWWGGGIMYINNAYPQNSECSCYQGILRNCMSGTQTLKATDSAGKAGVLRKDSADGTASNNNAQMLPLTHKQRRILPDR